MYWFQTLDWAYATNSAALAEQTFESSCRICRQFVSKSIDEVAERGDHYVGGRLNVTERAVAPNDSRQGATQAIDAAVHQSALRVVNSSGRTVERAEEVKRGLFRTWLRWQSGGWIVVDWRQGK